MQIKNVLTCYHFVLAGIGVFSNFEKLSEHVRLQVLQDLIDTGMFTALFPNTGSGPICGPQRYFCGSPIYFPTHFLVFNK